MKKGEFFTASTIVFAALALVSGVIGLGIVDTISTSTQTYTHATNETHTLSAVPQAFTTNYYPVETGSVVIQNNAGNTTLVLNTNYTILDYSTGSINITSYSLDQGTTLKVTYNYEGDEFLSSSLSRTIVQYIVPVALLGLLAFAAGILYLKV